MTFPIVGIASSAGGLEAITELLDSVPADIGMAFVVIQHLERERATMVPALLGRTSALPVLTACDGMAVNADHVYVMPENSLLRIENNLLRVSLRPGPPDNNMPGDIFLRSLAESATTRAVGVVLSGGDSDGTRGIEAVKEAGGIVFAQTPETARVPSMPRNAIASGQVDFVMRPTDIASELARLNTHTYLHRPLAAGQEEAESSAPSAVDEPLMLEVFRILKDVRGVDFKQYKQSTLKRRLTRRMALRRVERLSDYLPILEAEVGEVHALYQDFLIRVTGFFRDADSFAALQSSVFPLICADQANQEPIRVWVAGCATGEEVYSLAILLTEFIAERRLTREVQFFGTDVSDIALEKARAGIYPASIAHEVSSERLARYFTLRQDHYQIAKSLRDRCVFARHDVTRDPPFSRLDLISCRNMLIYLSATAQRRVMAVFHYALKRSGYLMLGASESIGPAAEYFDTTDRQHRIYERKARSPLGVLDSLQQLTPASVVMKNLDLPVLGGTDVARREADRVMLARYAPAGLLIDDQMTILQFRGDTSPFLKHASGNPSFSLDRVVRPELLIELVPALQETRKTGRSCRREGLRLGALSNVAIEVMPLKIVGGEARFLVLFDDGSRFAAPLAEVAAPASGLAEDEKDRRLALAERESDSMREFLQTTLQEHEAVKEELRVAHEEVLSANEEYQSTNEELETAKEELQSANEELTTTNEELVRRNLDLAHVSSVAEATRDEAVAARMYADAIIETVREPLAVLDDSLRVLRVNHSFLSMFRVRNVETEGCMLANVGNGQWNIPALIQKLHLVVERRESMVDYEVQQQFPLIGDRVMSLNARAIEPKVGRRPLLLLAIEDITERRARFQLLSDTNERKDEFLAILAHELRNPLMPIANAVHLMRKRSPDDANAGLYEMIERQTGRMVRLVDELLDLARIGRGTMELKREPIDLGRLVRGAADSARPRIEASQQILSITLPGEPVMVSGDPVRLEQVFANIIENAAKYTEPCGHISIELTTEINRVRVAVSDDGIGLPPEMLERIFEVFTQVDRTLTRSRDGLGLGLTVVRRIVDLHGGTIEAFSEGLGKGSRFVVTLPAAKVGDALRSRAEDPPKPLNTFAPRRVLIVDDNVDSAQSLQMLMSLWGHDPTIAPDGRTALELAARLAPQLAVINIGLPGMDGYQLARRLRERDPDIHLIALTGYGRAEDLEQAKSAGFHSHLVKPADLERLRQLIEES